MSANIAPRDNYREPSPRPVQYREYRIDREVSRDPPRPRDDYELESYSKTREYYRDDRPPAPIIIRESAPAPIIIREAAQQQLVVRDRERSDEADRRTEVSSSRALARREPSPEQDEDYYYEKRTRRIQRRDSDQDQDKDDKRSDRRSVHPKDSASNQGSDDESNYYYEKRTTEEWDGPGRDHSPNHKRHLAEGAIAGLGAAALVQNHNKKSGKNPGGAGRLAGGAALGALAAEGISRARSHVRSKSRGRDDARSPRSKSQDGRGRGEEETMKTTIAIREREDLTFQDGVKLVPLQLSVQLPPTLPVGVVKDRLQPFVQQETALVEGADLARAVRAQRVKKTRPRTRLIERKSLLALASRPPLLPASLSERGANHAEAIKVAWAKRSFQ